LLRIPSVPNSLSALEISVLEARQVEQRISSGHRSFPLDYLGLEYAAAGFCKELSERQNVEIEFDSDNIPSDLSKEISLCVFRVLQEALQNAVKHSGVRHFQVSLKGTSDSVELKVSDAGAGFNVDEAISAQGLGLTSMKERLKLVHGQLSIDSNSGQGTTIHARVPFKSDCCGAEQLDASIPSPTS